MYYLRFTDCSHQHFTLYRRLTIRWAVVALNAVTGTLFWQLADTLSVLCDLPRASSIFFFIYLLHLNLTTTILHDAPHATAWIRCQIIVAVRSHNQRASYRCPDSSTTKCRYWRGWIYLPKPHESVFACPAHFLWTSVQYWSIENGLPFNCRASHWFCDYSCSN